MAIRKESVVQKNGRESESKRLGVKSGVDNLLKQEISWFAKEVLYIIRVKT